MILAVCLNPTLQKTLLLPALHENEVNRGTGRFLDASGKGVNVARVLVQLGAEVLHLTHAGGRDRDLFLSLAGADGVRVAASDSGSEIRYCYTLLNAERGSTTEIVEESDPVGPGTEDLVIREFSALLPSADCVVISGTKAAGYSPSLYPLFTRMAKDAGKRVVLDLRGRDLEDSLQYRPDLVKPNFAEFAATFVTGRMGRETCNEPELVRRVEEAAREISLRFGTAVVLTRGGLPALCAAGGEAFTSPPEPLSPVNTIGCGDAFTAGFAAFWESAGLPPPETPGFAGVFSSAVSEGHRCAALNAGLARPGRIR